MTVEAEICKASWSAAIIDRDRLQLFISRVALAGAIAFTLLFATFIAGGIFSESALEQAELIGAANNPAAYRLASVFDILVWLALGATLVSLAGLIAPVAPIRAVMVAATGAGQAIGMLGGVLRLNAVTDLGAGFAAGGDQATVETAYLAVSSVVYGAFTAGALLYQIGFLLVGFVGLSLAGFPRWAALWLLGVGAIGLALNALGAVGVETDFVGFLYLMVGVLGLFVVLAIAFWRPRALAGS